MLRIFGLLVIAALALALFVPTPNFEEFVADVETHRLQESGQCPLSKEALTSASPETVVLCANFGLTAYQDAKRHQPSAERVYGLLGTTAELHEVRQTYGFKVIAVLDSYYTEGSTTAQLSNAAGSVIADVWSQLRTDPLNLSVPASPKELGPEELAVYALLNIKEHGEVFLAQFELLPDNTVVRKPVESVAQNAYSILMGGVRNFERKVVLGEELTAYDYGGAVLDVAIVFAGAKLLTKPVAAAGKAGKFATATARAMRALTIGVKAGAIGAVGLAAYVAVTDPLQFVKGVVSAGGWIANQIGLPTWVGQMIGWFIILVILWPIIWLVRKLVRFTSYFIPYRLIRQQRHQGV